MFYDMTDPDETGETRMRFAGKYDAEKFGIALSYQMLTDVEGVTDWKSTTFGGDVIFHANEKFDVKAGYYMIDPNTEELGGGTDQGCDLIAFGVDYNYVKNVQFYLQYAGIMNKDNGDFGLGDYNGFGAPTSVAATGETVSGFSFGTVIKF